MARKAEWAEITIVLVILGVIVYVIYKKAMTAPPGMLPGPPKSIGDLLFTLIFGPLAWLFNPGSPVAGATRPAGGLVVLPGDEDYGVYPGP